MNIDKAVATPGWMSIEELTYIAEVAEKSQCIAEIGSWRGRSTIAFAEHTPGVVYCVDTWADNAYGGNNYWTKDDPPDLMQRKDWLWDEFHKNLGERVYTNVFPYRMSSVEGARILRNMDMTFDAIFIDAGHSYADVVNDIHAWRPMLRENGILFGHDYGIFGPEVIKAVDELIGKVRVVDTIWTTEGA